MNIIITNTVCQNTGDAAILFAVMEQLRMHFEPNIKFTVLDKNPEAASFHNPGIDFRKSFYIKHSIGSRCLLMEALKKARVLCGAGLYGIGFKWMGSLVLKKSEIEDIDLYQSADLVISTGGTYLVENYNIEDRVLEYKIFILLKKPLFFFTQSLGPFTKTSNIKQYKKIFDASKLILVRDKASKKNLKDIGVLNTPIIVRPDAAFSLANLGKLNDLTKGASLNKSVIEVAVSVRAWPYFKKVTQERGMRIFKDSIKVVCIYLIEKYGVHITFISTCQGVKDYWVDDSKVASEIVASIAENLRKNITVDTDFHGPIEFQKIIGSFDFVIATRMHAMILALNEGVPVLPIAYEFKTIELADQLRLSDWLVDIETITPEIFLTKIDGFVNNLPKIKKSVTLKVIENCELSKDAGKKVRSYYQKNVVAMKVLS